MTETITEATTISDCRHDFFRQIIVTLLAPLFLVDNADEIRFVRIAALETLNAYRAREPADLLAVAQVIACGLAALHSLSLSMAGDMAVPMRLRLRGNAVALHRAAEQNRRAPRENRPEIETPQPAEAAGAATEPDGAPPAGPEPRVAAAQQRAAGTPAQMMPEPPVPTRAPVTRAATAPVPATEQWQAMWGSAAASMAAEYAASLPPFSADFGKNLQFVAPLFGLWRVNMAHNAECTPCFRSNRYIARHKQGLYPGGQRGVQYN